MNRRLKRRSCSRSATRADQLAEAAGLPRTNFGRRLKNRLRRPLERLLAAGLIEEERDRDQLTEKGRTTLAERFDAIR
jgi:ribosomal protein S19E (S16A)